MFSLQRKVFVRRKMIRSSRWRPTSKFYEELKDWTKDAQLALANQWNLLSSTNFGTVDDRGLELELISQLARGLIPFCDPVRSATTTGTGTLRCLGTITSSMVEEQGGGTTQSSLAHLNIAGHDTPPDTPSDCLEEQRGRRTVVVQWSRPNYLPRGR